MYDRKKKNRFENLIKLSSKEFNKLFDQKKFVGRTLAALKGEKCKIISHQLRRINAGEF